MTAVVRGVIAASIFDIHQKIALADINEHRLCPKSTDGGNRRHRGVGHGIDLIAGLHAQRRERDINGVGSAVDTNRHSPRPDRQPFRSNLMPSWPRISRPGLKRDPPWRGLVAQFVVFPKIIPDIDWHHFLTDHYLSTLIRKRYRDAGPAFGVGRQIVVQTFVVAAGNREHDGSMKKRRCPQCQTYYIALDVADTPRKPHPKVGGRTENAFYLTEPERATTSSRF